MANNNKTNDSKRKIGALKQQHIKTSDFLPGVFNTPLNKKWLDATYDQMVSKGELQALDAYVGSKHGKHATTIDNYLAEPVHGDNRRRVQLQPSIITRGDNSVIDRAIAFDDVANNIATKFDTYNYNAAYATQRYVYRPPIDIDKFVNFSNYYWVYDMPVYESVNSGTPYNPIDVIRNVHHYTLVDDNNEVELQNGMVIKFVSGYAEADGYTYIVSGIGTVINLIPFYDPDGNQLYTDETSYTDNIGGYWNPTEIYTFSKQDIDVFDSPFDAIEAFNISVESEVNNRPFVRMFNIDLNSYDYLTHGTVLSFDPTWPDLEEVDINKVYFCKVNTDNTVELITLIDAVIDGDDIVQTIPESLDEFYFALANSLTGKWDKASWDSTTVTGTKRDYIVIDKADSANTAWSRSNHWVHQDTIKYVTSLVSGTDSRDYINAMTQAVRPIIEFDRQIKLFNAGFKSKGVDNKTWLGIVDFITDDRPIIGGAGDSGYTMVLNESIQPGAKVVFDLDYTDSANEDLNKVFVIINNSGDLDTLENYDFNVAGQCMFVRTGLTDATEKFNNNDLYFNGTNLVISQVKEKHNQAPLFQLHSYTNTPLDEYDESNFAGSKIFSYKESTGTVDTELDFPLTYKDVGRSADIVFENNILTDIIDYTIADSKGNSIGYRKQIPGIYFYVTNERLQTVYVPSEVPSGALEELQVIYAGEQTVSLPVGAHDWEVNKEFIASLSHGEINITEAINNSVATQRRISPSTLSFESNKTYKFHDLITGKNLQFADNLGTVFTDGTPGTENNVPGLVVTRDGDDVLVTTSSDSDQYYTYGIDLDVSLEFTARVSIVQHTDVAYHTVTKNGVQVNRSDYTVTENTIEIPGSMFELGDIIDLEYYPTNIDNSTLNTQIPDTVKYNATNELVSDITVSETLDHWTDLLERMPDFEGQSFGNNNSYKILQTPIGGGKIIIHENPTVGFDIAYADSRLDIGASLFEQGRDYWGFKQRFIGQVKRLFASGNYLIQTDVAGVSESLSANLAVSSKSVKELVNDAIRDIALTRKGTDLHSDSNMAYAHADLPQATHIIEDASITDYSIGTPLHRDTHVRDHVYVYLTDDRDSNDILVERLLVKDTDYELFGDFVRLKLTPNFGATTGIKPVLEMYVHRLDEDSYIPASMAKLDLAYVHVPCYDEAANVIVGHDGDQYTVQPNTELEDYTSDNFDPIAAAIFELEKRIHTGIIRCDHNCGFDPELDRKTAAFEKYLPSQSRFAWYTYSMINSYIESSFNTWRRSKNYVDLGTGNADADGWEWNYSALEIGEHAGTQTLPGYWIGAYFTLFGTNSPHINPWHMLGFSHKPAWWDTYYSWTDTAKREALLLALKTGIVNNPNEETVTQDIDYARYYWDWDNHCPVDDTGELVGPAYVLNALGALTEQQKSEPFVFGDWGPVESMWRLSSLGHSAMTDAVVALNPARAWTDLYQPGTVQTNTINGINVKLDYLYESLLTPSNYRIPGSTQFSSVTSVDVEYSEAYTTTPTVKFLNGFSIEDAKGVVNLDPETRKITSISLDARGFGYKETPIIDIVTEEDVVRPLITSKVQPVKFVANGIAQVQYNRTLRNYYDVDLDRMNKTVDTALSQKMGGFTDKTLIDWYAESSAYGAFRISSEDYSLQMYRGACTSLIVASMITVTKTDSGYVVRGVTEGQQRFVFNEPLLTGNNDYVNIDLNSQGAVIKKYKKFSTQDSIAEYGTKFARIQDLYNFIRGNRHWLETQGYKFLDNKDAVAAISAQWAAVAEIGSEFVVDLGTVVRFTPDHGYVSEFNTLPRNLNAILTTDGDIIDDENILVDRSDNNELTVSARNNLVPLGSVAVSVQDFEHIVLFNDVTGFGRTIFNDVIDQRYNRLKLVGNRTSNWSGKKSADGYLIKDGGITQNFDSSVAQSTDYYNLNNDRFNSSTIDAERAMVNNIPRDWVNSLGLPEATVQKFFQGAMREKGTNQIVDRIGRSNIVNLGNSDVSIDEEFMFRQSNFGDVTSTTSLEFTLSKDDIINDPQLILFNDGTVYNTDKSIIDIAPNSDRYINNTGTDFQTVPFDEYAKYQKLPTAGELRQDEADNIVSDISEMLEMWDSTADYSNIETWDDSKSYKLGDLVRYAGSLHECAVNSTGLNIVSDGIFVQGITPYPTFASGTIVNIDSTTFALAKTKVYYDDIVATGSEIIVDDIPFGTTLIVDGETIVFGEVEGQTIKNPDAYLAGDPYSIGVAIFGGDDTLLFQSVAGMEVEINGTTVNFDDTPDSLLQEETGTNNGVTPSDITESKTGVVDETDYAIIKPLSPTTWSVSEVTVDNVITTDFTVAGQTLTINTPVMTGGEDIEVTLEHVTVIDLEDTFTVTQELGGEFGWVVGNVTVDGIAQVENGDYIVDGQDIIFSNVPAEGDEILIAIDPTPKTMTVGTALTKISNEVDSVQAYRNQQDRIELHYSTGSTDIVTPLVVSNTLALASFGLTPGAYSPTLIISPTSVDESLSDAIIKINDNVTTVVASNSGDRLSILKATNGEYATLTIGGTGRALFGFDSQYIPIGTDLPVPLNVTEAVSQINQELVNDDSEVSLSVLSGRISIETSNSTLDLGAGGTGSFNAVAGLPSGIQTEINSDIVNQFNPAQWNIADENDPALFNVWVINDSGMKYNSIKLYNAETESTTNIQSKFNDWNLFQVMNNPALYPLDNDDADGCAICAGVATSDGNDARITSSVAHNLQVGDFVMLTNTTTVPSTDGIHMVTRVESTRQFYIDMYIERCGTAPTMFVIKPVKFVNEADMIASAMLVNEESNTRVYNYGYGDLAYTQFRTIDNEPNRSTNTYRYTGETSSTYAPFSIKRAMRSRVINTSIRNVLVYDPVTSNSRTVLEVYDPIIGLIPGVADREIDTRSPVDLAAYTDSTNLAFDGTDTNYWADEQVGRVWWDTSTVNYFDYTQDLSRDFGATVFEYDSTWGHQAPGSTVDIYEWTKSSVAPDEWETAVEGNIDMFGVPASGTVYTEVNKATDEVNYYYSQVEEWNRGLGKYTTVYYFWVKDKDTVNTYGRNLTVSQIASIINDPTAAGIQWTAAVYDNVLLLSNPSSYLGDSTTAVQINNVPAGIEHSAWQSIRLDKDLIPDYWYYGLRSNLMGVNYELGFRYPNTDLHEYNRFGDDRRLGQGWFKDVYDARREVISTANLLLKEMNIIEELDTRWDRILNSVIYSVGVVKDTVTSEEYDESDISEYRELKLSKDDRAALEQGTKSITDFTIAGERDIYFINYDGYGFTQTIYRAAISINMTDMWIWADYVHPNRYPEQYPSLELKSRDLLGTVNINSFEHTLVYIPMMENDLDRSEYYRYDLESNEWYLVQKNNATIQITDMIFNVETIAGWDQRAWDSLPWDVSFEIHTYLLLEAFRHDLFVGRFIQNFNKMFYSGIYHVLSTHDQVDWVYKNTYITLNVETPIEQATRKYLRSNISEVIGYMNTVKPFHTKIRNVYDINTIEEDVNLVLDEKHEIDVTISLPGGGTQEFNGTIVGSTFDNAGDVIYTAPSFTDTSEPEQILDTNGFLDADRYTIADTERAELYNLNPHANLAIEVSTNQAGDVFDSNSIKHVYLQDMNGAINVFGLTLTNKQAIVGEFNELATSVTIDRAAQWEEQGQAYINGEVFEWYQKSGNTLFGIIRSTSNTFAKPMIDGDDIYNITNTQISAPLTVRTSVTDDAKYSTAQIFNEAGVSLVDENTTSTSALQLQSQVGAIDPFITSNREITEESITEIITTPNGTEILHVLTTGKYYELTRDLLGAGGAIEEVLLSSETETNDTQIFVYDSDANLPDSGYCYMNGEIWYYGSKGSNIVFNDVLRGQLGTEPKVHPYPPVVSGEYTKVYYISGLELNVAQTGIITYLETGEVLVIE